MAAALHRYRSGRRVHLEVRFADEFRVNPHFDLEPDYVIRKSHFPRILRYIPRREILSTFHTRVENRPVP